MIMRKRFNFWLDDQYPGDIALYNLITNLKKPGRGQGKFTRAIRQGLRLWQDCANGNYDVFVELFPKVAARLIADKDAIGPLPPAATPNTDELDKKIARLEELALMISSNGVLMNQSIPVQTSLQQPAQPTGVGLKGLQQKQPLALPTFDDDEVPEISTMQNTSIDITANLLRGVYSLQ